MPLKAPALILRCKKEHQLSPSLASRSEFSRLNLAVVTRGSISPQLYGPRSETVHVAWCPPPPGVVKLNTDGASQGNPNKAGAGGLLRDSWADFFLLSQLMWALLLLLLQSVGALSMVWEWLGI